MSAGYSGRPLAAKLGIAEGMAALLVGVPDHLDDIHAHPGLARREIALAEPDGRAFDYIHVFETRRDNLVEALPALRAGLRPNGMLWVSWPKKASKVATDITEDVLREIFLPVGLVDVKVAAVDEVWSGLKFMFRKEIRSIL
jgi:hypothetical protein